MADDVTVSWVGCTDCTDGRIYHYRTSAGRTYSGPLQRWRFVPALDDYLKRMVKVPTR